MTKGEAVYKFFSQFGLRVFQEDAVPSGVNAPEYPYGTYTFVSDDFWGGGVPLSFSVWYNDTSWIAADSKVDEISKLIGVNGQFINCNGGAVWFKRGSPFATSTGDQNSPFIKRKKINITAEYITDY